MTGYGFGQGVARRQTAVSDVDRSFTLSVAEGVTSVVLLVGAAGRAFHAFSVPRTEQVVHLDVAPAGGLLRLRYRQDATRPHLTYQQAVIPLADAIPWARAQGAAPPGSGTIDLPAMAPGPYRFCATPAGQPESCSDGTLAAGSTLTLAVE